MDINRIIKRIKKYNKNADFNLVAKSYLFAKKAHSGQLRKSGNEYIIHPLNVAYILADLKLDEKIVSCAILHDVLEDTNVSLEIIERDFGKEIAGIIQGVTKISKMNYYDKKDYHAETIRKMLIATTKDIRVILVKLADRLDNMRTLQYLDEERQKRISRETLEIYVPIAYRLGIWKIKWELEDLSFKYLEPLLYKELKHNIVKKRKEREREVKKIIKIVRKELRNNKIRAKVFGRPKNFYSIYKKMKKKNIDISQIYDLQGLRIIAKDVKQCYEVLGVLHNLWKPIPNEFDDYIANPKPNMYQSIHTVVLMDNQKVEFQIRTEKMDDIAEEGIAAHWSYKDIDKDRKFEKSLGWLKQILEWKEKKDKDFLETLKIDLFGDNIFVFTPKGNVIELPKDSTPVDFAYAVHSQIGDRCTGARINEKFVSLRHMLQSNDIVEIMTSKNHKPSREWLKFVRSDRARQKIKQTLKELSQVPIQNKQNNIKYEWNEQGLISINISKAVIKIAKCCSPLPGDKISGISSKSKRVMIHKNDCQNLKNPGINKKRINAHWNEMIKSTINLKILAIDRVGLLADILNTIASTGRNVEKARARVLDKENSECIVSLKFDNLNEINELIKRIKKIADVKNVSVVI